MITVAFGPTMDKLEYGMIVKYAVYDIKMPADNKKFTINNLNAEKEVLYSRHLN